MRISNDQAQQILAAQGLKGPKASKATGGSEKPASASDAVSVSSLGQEIGKALASMSGIPDIRADRVAELKAQIEAGTYHVSGRDIAESVLRRATDQLL